MPIALLCEKVEHLGAARFLCVMRPVLRDAEKASPGPVEIELCCAALPGTVYELVLTGLFPEDHAREMSVEGMLSFRCAERLEAVDPLTVDKAARVAAGKT